MEYSIVNGKIRTYGLEIQAAEHCNLRCAGCSQSSPFLPPKYPNLANLEESLHILADVMRAGRATILGGEPLLNPQLLDLLRIVRESQVFEEIYVTTNGLLLTKVDEEFWKWVDVVEISLYPATRYSILRTLNDLSERAWQFKTEIHLLPSPTFQHITLTERIEDPRIVRIIYEKCYFRHYCHTLYEGHLYKCGPSTHIPDLVELTNGERLIPSDSTLRVEIVPGFRERVLNFFQNKKPMEVCRFCVGSSGSEYPHRQLSQKEINKPTKIRLSPSILREPIIPD
jgi:Radical SAM superfamily/4Fe-4S single cluster domain